MARRAQDIVKAAVKLPEKERVRVVEELLASLDTAPDEDIDSAWAAEIQRRSREIKEGSVQPLPWKAVKARARRRVRGGR